jgi:hypothetical protein
VAGLNKTFQLFLKSCVMVVNLAHEKEVRILTPSVRFNQDGISLNKDQFTQKGVNIKCQLQTLIQAVIVGPCADPHFFTLIERLVGRYRLCVEVEKSQLPNLASLPKPTNLPT